MLKRLFRRRALRASSSCTMLASQLAPHHNSGFWVMNGALADHPTPATVVITGLGRSGTSMLAAVLQQAGLCIGEQVAVGTYEDQQLAALIRQGNQHALGRWIDQRNQRHQRWGFKLPSRQVLEPELLGQLRRPVLVVIFRDILAIAGRRQVSRGEDLLLQLSQALQEYQGLVAQLMALGYPCLLVSYEKALLQPRILVEQLDQFLGLGLSDATRAACIAAIQASPDLYRREVRQLRNWQGRLESVKADAIAGWAFVVGADGVADVEVWVNGAFRHSCAAHHPRLDVQTDHQLPHNRCGFSLNLAAIGEALNPGDEVSVRLANTQEELLNSPQRLPGCALTPPITPR